jgi:uncharacterized protein (DUF488 family)
MKQLSLDIPTKLSALFTVGYQGRDLEAFVRLLEHRGIARVVDVRQHPSSRRPGFAKSPLSKALARADVDYVHVREAGNPFRHAEGASIGAILARYASHLDAHDEITARVAEVVAGATSALLCFERDAAQCHRTPLAERVARRLGIEVVAL